MRRRRGARPSRRSSRGSPTSACSICACPTETASGPCARSAARLPTRASWCSRCTTIPQHVNQALADGACGYIVKSIEPGELASAIRHTVDGTVFTSAGAPSSLRSTSQDSPQRLITERELEILQYVAEGLSNSQIGKQLWVTEQTVKFHLSNIYRKLGVSNRTEASRYALRHGLVRSDDTSPALSLRA